MRHIFLGAGGVLALFLLVAYSCIWYGLVPINADAPPSTLERWVARTALIAGVQRNEIHRKNPASGQTAMLDGITIYKHDCQMCHGDASGRVGAAGRGLYQEPPNFGKKGIEDIPYSYDAWVVRHGIRLTGMPAFSRSLTQKQMDDVVLFLQHMNSTTPYERAVRGPQKLRAALASLYRELGGIRACSYFPSPNVKPHRFLSDVEPSGDGQFLMESYYNAGISEIGAIGYDAGRKRLVRVKLSKDGTPDVAVSSDIRSTVAVWRSVGLASGAVTTIVSRPDGGYEFRASNQPGYGECSPTATASDVTTSADASQTAVLAQEGRWVAAYARGDRGALGKVLAPGFVHINYAGEVRSRAEELKAINGSPPPYEERTSEHVVVLLGDVAAIVHGFNMVTHSGKVVTRLRYTDVYVDRLGSWQAISAQETPIGGP